MIFTNVSISGPTRRTCVPACTYDNAYQPTPTTCQLCPYGTFADARATTPDSWRCNDCSRIDPDAESCATLYQSYEWGSPSPYIIKWYVLLSFLSRGSLRSPLSLPVKPSFYQSGTPCPSSVWTLVKAHPSTPPESVSVHCSFLLVRSHTGLTRPLRSQAPPEAASA